MMMMVMIAAYVSSITTPIRSWLQKHSHNNNNIMMMMIKEEVIVNSCSGVEVECMVCLSEVVLGERLAMLQRCGHGYHVECLQEWLKDHPNCPLCRTPALLHQHTPSNFFDIYGTAALETMAAWLTGSFTQGLHSTLSESCNYL